MIRKGSLVKYLGDSKKLWNGRMLSVESVNGDSVTVYTERNAKGKWLTINVPKKDVKEVVE